MSNCYNNYVLFQSIDGSDVPNDSLWMPRYNTERW